VRRAGSRTVHSRWFCSIAFVAVLAVWPSAALAQVYVASDAPRRGSVELDAGVVAFAGIDIGASNAELTRNINTGTGPFTLFAADSRIAAAPGAQLRVGVFLSRTISLESGFQYGRPKLSIAVSSDAEQAPDVTATETISRYVIDGSLLFHLHGLAFAGGRGVPFLAGGAGYVRELHERNEFMESGREYHALAGLKMWFGQGPPRFGLRADVGASIRSGGTDFRSGHRTVPTGGVSLAYLF
jgi:hypothetical protein